MDFPRSSGHAGQFGQMSGTDRPNQLKDITTTEFSPGGPLPAVGGGWPPLIGDSALLAVRTRWKVLLYSDSGSDRGISYLGPSCGRYAEES